MEWTEIFPTLNGIVGGVIMAMVGWLVATGRLHLGRETTVYKTLWEQEQEKNEKLETINDNLTADLRRNNETLVVTSTGLAKANEELISTNRRLDEHNKLMREILETKPKGVQP